MSKHHKLIENINRTLLRFNGLTRLLRGNIYKVKKKSRGSVYKAYQLTYKGENNITKTIYIKKENFAIARKSIQNYKNAICLLEKIVNINIKLIKS